MEIRNQCIHHLKLISRINKDLRPSAGSCDRSVLFLHTQLTGRRDAKCNALERFLRIEYTHRLVFVCKHSLICFLQPGEIPCFQEFFIVLLIIRLVAIGIMRLMARKNRYRSYSPFWDQVDSVISPFSYKVSGIFTKKFIPFTTSLIIATVFSILAVKLGDFVILMLCNLLLHLPF